MLAKIGRWLAAEHPEVTEPGQWTRQTCASWVAAVDRMSVGDFSQWTHGMHSQGRLGKPLTAQSKSGYLKVPRAFFRDRTNGSGPHGASTPPTLCGPHQASAR
ncbi:hypothetical protein ACFC00_40270 [Streptomyces adustus]|uniref:hypothetical protein n=1 Tax=Streptomyces adustus TaxID=1609272 RepID=UPI0035DC1D12